MRCRADEPIIRCRIAVPSVLFACPESGAPEEPTVAVCFQPPGAAPEGCERARWEVFTASDAARIASWLEAGASALDAAHNGGAAPRAAVMAELPGDSLARDRCALYGAAGDALLGDALAVDRTVDTVRLCRSDPCGAVTYALPAPCARALAGALRDAVARLAARPPRVLTDARIAQVAARTSADLPTGIGVAVEAGVSEPASPRVMLDVPPEGCNDTWRLTDDEAAALGAALERVRDGALAAPAEFGPADAPWLTVRSAGDGAATLHFDDDLVREAGQDGVLRLDRAATGALAAALHAARSRCAAHPPHVFVAPEPLELLVAELCWPLPPPRLLGCRG